jgi:chondroitin 4-sulfotransferase 11
MQPAKPITPRDFIFIHINKTGGTSIEKALSLEKDHLTAAEKKASIGKQKWKKIYSFAFVRNPWDKVVSHYHHRVKMDITDLKNSKVEFKEWVKLTYNDKDSYYYDNPRMFMPQVEWISDAQGRIIVKQVFRFERLNRDFNYLCEKLKLPNKQLPHFFQSERTDYRDYYNSDTADLIRESFQKDIKKFGYQFD